MDSNVSHDARAVYHVAVHAVVIWHRGLSKRNRPRLQQALAEKTYQVPWNEHSSYVLDCLGVNLLKFFDVGALDGPMRVNLAKSKKIAVRIEYHELCSLVHLVCAPNGRRV